MVDNIEWQAKFDQIVISEIKGHNIELDADNMFGYVTLDLEQMEDIKVKKFDTLRGGGTEFIYNPSAISDVKTIEESADSKAISAQASRKHEGQS